MTALVLLALLGGADGPKCETVGGRIYCEPSIDFLIPGIPEDKVLKIEELVGPPLACWPFNEANWCCSEFKCDAKSGTCVWAKCAPEKKP